MDNKTIKELAIELTVEITGICDNIRGRSVYINQLMKSCSSIGANSHEAKYAQSRADFIHKMEIALKETYETKESNVLKLLEKKFPSGQLSYYRFKEEVDSCRVSFFKEADAAENMIELSDEYSQKIADELKNKVKTLQEIVGKMNDLQSELIISISNGDDGSDDEISNLINEMNDLIDSVKNYE